jgi:hypothetical protein
MEEESREAIREVCPGKRHIAEQFLKEHPEIVSPFLA